MNKNEFNLEAFKSIREEINRRIDTHYRLMLAKYVLVGAVLSFLLTNEQQAPIRLSPFLLSAAFAFLLDVVILENLGWIRNAGSYIRHRIENTDLNIVRWEGEGAQAGGRWNCFTVRGYLFGSWSAGAFLFLTAFADSVDPRETVDQVAIAVTGYLMLYSLYLVFNQLGRRGWRTGPDVRQSPIVEDGPDLSRSSRRVAQPRDPSDVPFGL